MRTLLADFMSVDAAAHVTSAIIASGIVPAALEFMDGPTIRVVEDSIYAAGYPRDAEAVLLIELDGLEAGVSADLEAVRRICLEGGARNVKVARDDAERLKLWQGRKKAFGAMGRLAPHLIVQDAVIPAHATAGDSRDDSRHQREVRRARVQRLSRRRRQSSSEHRLQRRRSGRERARAQGDDRDHARVHRCRRQHHRRARRRARQDGLHGIRSSPRARSTRCASCAACSIPSAGRIQARWFRFTPARNGNAVPGDRLRMGRGPPTCTEPRTAPKPSRLIRSAE